jgi:hypothetical protein
MIQAYYHIYLTDDKHWISIFLDQFKTIRDCSLDKKIDTINITAVGEEEDLDCFLSILKNYREKILRCNVQCTWYKKPNKDEELKNFNSKKGNFITETSTLQKIWNDCNEASDDFEVLYFHAKGVTSLKRHLDKNDNDFGYDVLINYFHWRKFLDWSVLENHANCLDILSEKNVDIVGANYTRWPSPHFSGNYWWANSSYIKTLSSPLDSNWWESYRRENNFPHFFSDRIKDEMWILSNKKHRHHSVFDHKDPPPKSTLASTLILRDEYTK